MVTSDINEVIDRSIEKLIYTKVLAEGYTPNRLTYANDPAGYQVAIDAIIVAKGFAIAMFGAASNQQKQLKYVPRIVYSHESYLPGTVGSDRGHFYESNGGGGFEKKIRQPITSNLRFGIYLISQNSKQDRILHGILSAAMPNSSYVPFYNNPSISFYVTYGYSTSSPDLSHGLIQKKYLFEAHDLYEAEDLIVDSNAAAIQEITVQDDEGDTLHQSTN